MPMIISTGMSTLPEIRSALNVAQRSGHDSLGLLHCVSAYPTPVDAQNLRAISTLSNAFSLPTGLSDHGCGLSSAVAAVALGACIYERHLVLDGDDLAIDRAVSSTPSELRAIVKAMDEARQALGTGAKVCQPAEAPNVNASRRGLYAARDLRPGHRVTPRDILVLRPASGLAPSQASVLVGSILQRDVRAGEPFHAADLEHAESLA
jgi:sialic acid synthase SpsE